MFDEHHQRGELADVVGLCLRTSAFHAQLTVDSDGRFKSERLVEARAVFRELDRLLVQGEA